MDRPLFDPVPDDSKTQPKHGRVGAGRRTAERRGRGGARQFGAPMSRFARETTVPLALQSIEENCSERFSGSTGKGIKPVESKTLTYHGPVGSGGARWGGLAGRARQVCSRRTQTSLVPSRASKTNVLNVSPEARTKEFLCKPMGEQSPRLTRGL